MVYLYPITLLFEIQVIGKLTIADIVGFFVVIYFLINKKSGYTHKYEKSFNIYISLWLIAQIITDIYRSSSFDDLAKGWSKIIFIAIIFNTIRLLIKNDIDKARKFVLITYAVCAMRVALGLFEYRYTGHPIFGMRWRFGYGQLFTLATLYLSARLLTLRGGRPLSKALPYFAAAINLACSARNLFGIAALSALANSLIAGRTTPLDRRKALLFGGLVAIAGVATLWVYAYTASHGLLGNAAFLKYVSQSAGTNSPLGLILSGRNESFASLQAIWDSPIIGHGANAQDFRYIVIRYLNMQTQGMHVETSMLWDTHIPTHSLLLGSWVEAGIVGALFWFWAMRLAVRGAVTALKLATPYTGFYIFVCISLLWDILFSPLNTFSRLMLPAEIYLIILLCAQDSPRPSSAPSLRAKTAPAFAGDTTA